MSLTCHSWCVRREVGTVVLGIWSPQLRWTLPVRTGKYDGDRTGRSRAIALKKEVQQFNNPRKNCETILLRSVGGKAKDLVNFQLKGNHCRGRYFRPSSELSMSVVQQLKQLQRQSVATNVAVDAGSFTNQSSERFPHEKADCVLFVLRD